METNFAPTFFDSLKRMINRQRWYWKTWDFLRYDMPRFFRNLWIFRKDLYNYRWYSGQNAVLPFMKTALNDMAAKIDERGIEVEHSKSKKIGKMLRAAYIMERFIEDDFLEWFVNNPRCEWVEVKKEMYMPFDGKVPFELSLDQSLNTCPHYKIITKDYLQGFIDLHNNELEHWDAVEFLEWLKLNDFKIVKN